MKRSAEPGSPGTQRLLAPPATRSRRGSPVRQCRALGAEVDVDIDLHSADRKIVQALW